MSWIMLQIPGPPIAKKRPRFVRKGKFVSTYNPQETEEGRFLFDVQGQMKNREPLEGPVCLHADFMMPIPKAMSKKRREVLTRGTTPHIKKPDLDNLVKFVKDCLNRVAWRDDAQVAEIRATKVYAFAGEPCTRIMVQPLPDQR